MKTLLAFLILAASYTAQARSFYESAFLVQLSYSNVLTRTQGTVGHITAQVTFSDDNAFCQIQVGSLKDNCTIGNGQLAVSPQTLAAWMNYGYVLNQKNTEYNRVREMLISAQTPGTPTLPMLVYQYRSGGYSPAEYKLTQEMLWQFIAHSLLQPPPQNFTWPNQNRLVYDSIKQVHDPKSNYESVHYQVYLANSAWPAM